MSHLTIIVAATRSNGIGQNSRLPWRLPKEMAYFARITSNAPERLMNAVIMGRKTWESIPRKYRPLPKRMNIIISTNKDYELMPHGSEEPDEPLFLHSDLKSALDRVARSKEIHRCFIIGGASLYSETLQLPKLPSAKFDRIMLTRILEPAFEECDVFMPDILKTPGDGEEGSLEWHRASHQQLLEWSKFEVPEGVQEENGVKYEFQMWVR